MGIGLIELTEPSNILNYKPFFKHCILQNILQYFYCLYLRGTKSTVLKTEQYFTSFLIWFGLAFDVTVLKVIYVSGRRFIRLKGIRDSLATADIICWQ